MKTLFFVGLLAMALIGSSMADEVPAVLPPCICPRNYQPICANNGVTYDNECMFKCYRTDSINRGLGTIEIVKSGTCNGESWI